MTLGFESALAETKLPCLDYPAAGRMLTKVLEDGELRMNANERECERSQPT
jgi:hypothetical protein